MSHGPFRADQLRPGDSYELSNGHPIHCLPTGGRGARASSVGSSVLASDPAVESVGFDAGFSPSPDVLRAPDISVGNIPNEPGWVHGVPMLAIEYADTGQDEQDLATKLQELLDAGTRYIWVVRLTGPRRVEVHQAGKKMSLAHPGEELRAPGALANPVPVEALYDGEVGREVILRNLLQRKGFDSLEAVEAEGEARGRVEGEAQGRVEGEAQGRVEGEAQGLRDAVVAVLTARGFAVGDDLRTALSGAQDPVFLRSIVQRAAVAASAEEILTAL